MATYIIGDLQGCLAELDTLLNEVAFRPSRDQLWLTGDLVARGPDSLGCLRRVMALGNAATTVLGNHDLHLLAVANGIGSPKSADKIMPVLNAADSSDLLYWLRQQPLLAEYKAPKYRAAAAPSLNTPAISGFVMTHAGIPPQWNIEQARIAARSAEAELRSANYKERLAQMYGNFPDFWQPDLTAVEQLRFTINAFTRMRFCHSDGRLDFKHNGAASDAPDELLPWFNLRQDHQDPALIFGHWAALEGECEVQDIYALDTGCVWGGSMTLLCWETGERISTPCPLYA
ncbi:symmetrical bis(5'-nucleosyl)-tetraphosphatase [Oceanisphaera sp. W20_SRM_FM3]|uniref:symmetrical bis(5'-nucleosyl)-tetraphosphatase n=1 Tax=Oceanisphaera sp. W20_SRM_FM3 TaxID=3240267 RepID=UPI003F9B792C